MILVCVECILLHIRSSKTVEKYRTLVLARRYALIGSQSSETITAMEEIVVTVVLVSATTAFVNSLIPDFQSTRPTISPGKFAVYIQVVTLYLEITAQCSSSCDLFGLYFWSFLFSVLLAVCLKINNKSGGCPLSVDKKYHLLTRKRPFVDLREQNYYLHCVSKKPGTHIIPHNSLKCGPILIILSLSYSWMNCRKRWY